MGRGSRLRHWPAFLAAAALVAGCNTYPTRDRVDLHPDLVKRIAFLDEPAVTRSIVEQRIGPPLSTFENGRIVGYRIRMVSKAFPGQPPNPIAGYDVAFESSREPGVGIQLMIEYDARGEVVRHALTY
jgi:hypothetical protein